MAQSIDSMERLRNELNSFPQNESLMKWQDEGKKVVGWVCNYVPEEVIYAAGLLPIRILGDEGAVSKGDDYLQSNMCSFIRACLGQGLEKRYAFLDGAFFAHSCDGICRLFDAWKIYVKTPYTYLLDHPHKISDSSRVYHYRELEKLKESLENLSGQGITDEALQEAIKVYNENRMLLKQIHMLMTRDNPPLTGTELSEVILSSMIMPKDQSNLLLKELLKELVARDGTHSHGPRLMVSGSIVDNSAFVRLVEDCGAMVVTDDLCTGTRYFFDSVEYNGTENPLAAIGLRYLNMVPCACIEPPFARFDYVSNMVEEYKVNGVILYGLMFCDTFQYDFVGQRKRLGEKNIPVLEVELEQPSLGLGQLRTRIEAFLEML